MSSWEFVHSTRRVVQGWGSLARLADIAKAAGSTGGATRSAVVIDEFFSRSAVQERLRELVREGTGSEPAFHVVPAREPDLSVVSACAMTFSMARPELIVVVGGGSAIDAAKVARMLLSNPGDPETLAGPGKRLAPHPSLLVAVPTTAGTGAEVSESSVIGREGRDAKLIYHSQEMTPQVALLDPELTASMPSSVTAESGFDAVTHAVEAYVSRRSSEMTEPYALAAMQLLGRWLPVAFAEPGNREARGACLIASMQAAIAFNSANLGLAHAISGPLSAQQHAGHGLGNAMALPHVMAFNAPAIGGRDAVIAQCFGAPLGLPRGTSAAAALSHLRHQLGLDRSLDEFVQTDEDRERLAVWAMKSGQVASNPRDTSIEDIRHILAAMRVPTGGAAPSPL